MTAENHDEKTLTVREHGTGIYSWYVVIVLLIMNMFAWLDRQIIVLLIDPIRHDLGITEVQIGLLTGFAFALLHAICGLPLGWAVDRFSRRWIVFLGVVGWSFATVTCGLARNFWQLFAGRVGVGIGEATLAPAMYSILADTFPPKKLGFANSILSMGVAFGLGSSFLVGGMIASAVSHGELLTLPVIGEIRAWQAAFLAVGAPGLLVAFLALTIREPKRTESVAILGADKVRISEAGYLKKHWTYYFCQIGGMSIQGISSYAMMTWGPVYLSRVFEWNGARIGATYGAVMASGMVVALLIGGRTVDYLYTRGVRDAAPRLYAITTLINVPLTIFAVLSHNPWTFLVSLFFWLVISVGSPPNCIAAMQTVTPNKLRGLLVSVYLFFVTMLGTGLGPLFVAMLTQYFFMDDKMVGWSLMIVIVCANPIASLLLWQAARLMRKI